MDYFDWDSYQDENEYEGYMYDDDEFEYDDEERMEQEEYAVWYEEL